MKYMRLMIRKNRMLLALAMFCVLALAAARLFAVPAQSTPASSNTYEWSGELVALDEPSRMLTVKTNVVGDQALKELPAFKPGERIALTFSGYDKYASGIYRVAKYDATKKSDERFTFPVEFVSYDTAHQYVTFKTQIPAEDIAKIKSLKPGEWVTATSQHGESAKTQPIVMIRPFVISPAKS